jgi:hypothetical protein
MVETTTVDASNELTENDSAALTMVAERLDDTPEELDIFEGVLSGSLYVAVSDGYKRASVGGGGLQVAHVAEPEVDEELDPLAHVEPDEGETVQDAVNNLSFAGD